MNNSHPATTEPTPLGAVDPLAPVSALDASAMVQLAHMLLAAAKSPMPAGSVSSLAPGTPPARQPLVIDVVHEMLAWKSGRGLAAIYLNQLGYQAKRFGAWFARPMSELKAETVREYLGTIDGSARTKNNALATIRTVANFARSRRYLPPGFDEMEWVERFRCDTEEDVEIYTPDDIRRMLAFAGKGRAAIAIQAFAGLRTAEVCRLDWREVDMERGHILVSAAKAKTRQKRLAPISENLAEWLRRLRKDKGPIYSDNPNMYCANGVSSVCIGAGVKRRANGLRHSFGSYRLAVLKNEHALALEMGNSPQMIFKHYRAVVFPNAAKEYWSILPESVGVSSKLRRVLAFICLHPGCCSQEISQALYATSAWVTGGRLAARLRTDGLIAVQRDGTTGAPRYWITDAGRAVLAQDTSGTTPVALPNVVATPKELAA